MIPLPDLITKALTLPLQMLSSKLATGLLQLTGIPVFRQGNIIDLGVRQMQIVDACSGLRYILALLALGIIFCYFYQRKHWKIAILILILIPGTILANGVRVAAMGVYPALLSGFWHAFSGWLIFIFCFGLLALVNLLLNRLSPPKAVSAPPAELEPLRDSPDHPQKYWIYCAAALIIILIFIPITARVSYAPNYPLKDGFENFPMTIDSWKGRRVHIDQEAVAVTHASAYLNAEYTDPEQGPVGLWIAYYETQKKGMGFVHSPKGCFVASGWQIEKSKIIEIEKGKPVNWMLVNRMGERLLVYYWFLQRGRWVADETMNKLYMAYDGLSRRRTDGAMIRIISPIRGNIEATEQKLNNFLYDIAPIFNNFIPR